jgi:uncharacterized protein YaaQ
MVLLVVVVQSEDAPKLSQQLVEGGFRVTRIPATGGFLTVGSEVLLVGVEEDEVPAVAAVIEATCHTRVRLINAAPWPGMAGAYVMGTVTPVEVTVGGAVVFALPVERFMRLEGRPASATAAVSAAAAERMATMTAIPELAPAETGVPQATGTAGATKLVVAIVHGDDADDVVKALMAAGHRLTRINTAGGFLRRGNATLLIGVEAPRLDDVLAVIEANCRQRAEPAPIEKGMPMYGATVFVLDASHFQRF